MEFLIEHWGWTGFAIYLLIGLGVLIYDAHVHQDGDFHDWGELQTYLTLVIYIFVWLLWLPVILIPVAVFIGHTTRKRIQKWHS